MGALLAVAVAALIISRTIPAALLARSHRDITGFVGWLVVTAIVVLIAASTIVARDFYADTYDRVTSFLSDN